MTALDTALSAVQALADSDAKALADSQAADAKVLADVKAADAASLAALQARYDAYVLAHPDTPPPPPAVKTHFGISVNDSTDVARVEAMTSPDAVTAVRSFYTGKLVSQFDAKCKAAYENGVRDFWLSWHTPITADLLAGWKKSAPSDITVRMTEDHEPENDSPVWTKATWDKAQTQASNIVRAAGYEFWMILMGWTANPASGRDLEAWATGNGVHNGYAVDIYNRDMSVGLGRFQAFAKKHGMPWAITETGASTKVDGTPQSPAQRLAWAQDTRKVILGFPDVDRPKAALWWDVKNADTGFDNTMTEPIADAFFGT